MSLPARQAQMLDVFNVPLKGLHNIEASAGTGKTWNICMLYLRLVLEYGLGVEQILVMSFTNSAAAELKSRIYARLNDLIARLENPQLNNCEPALLQLYERLRKCGLDDAQMLKRSLLARTSFDEAAIFTMHGFCQRLLTEMPFNTGEPLHFKIAGRNDEIYLEYARDYWRRHIFTLDETHLAIFQHLYNHPPLHWAQALQQVAAAPLDTVLWPESNTQAQDQLQQAQQRFIQAFQNAANTWPDAAQTLQKAINRFDLRTYKTKSLTIAEQYWQNLFNHQTPPPILPTSTSASYRILFCADYQAQKLKKGNEAPQHPFFKAVTDLLNADEALIASITPLYWQRLRDMIENGLSEIAAQKRQQRRLNFDDLLRLTQQAVQKDSAFAQAIQKRYPAALIDEFQDTDPLQFDIFKRIYLSADEKETQYSLFLVGDPKQAIYRFRGADLPTYLHARSLAAHQNRHTLTSNQRADAPLIEALNLLFNRNPRAFIETGLQYETVSYGEKPRTPLTDNSGGKLAALQVLRLNTDATANQEQQLDCCARHCGAEIARLLAAADAIQIGGQPLRPNEIAILVNRHDEGRLMRKVLSNLGIGSIELSRTSVYASDEAKDLGQILQAILNPRPQFIAPALATRLYGYDYPHLRDWNNNPDAISQSVEQFRQWQWQWRKNGIAAMLRQWMRESALAERLLQLNSGERRLTNVIHLSELLSNAQNGAPNPEALLHHYETLCHQPGDEDAELLRLESDRNLVRIITIHSAKGLEYPLVFCPFVWRAINKRNSKTLFSRYHDPVLKRNVIDFRPEDKAKSYELERRQADWAEQARLLYVALTRAAHRCYLFISSSNTASLPHWLVDSTDEPLENWLSNADKRAYSNQNWQHLASSSNGTIELIDLPATPPSSLSNIREHQTAAPLQAQTPPAPMLPSWRNTSFTHLYQGATPMQFEIAPEHDSARILAAQKTTTTESRPNIQDEHDILNFPRGALAGECIHKIFEHYFYALAENVRPPSAQECEHIIEHALRLAPPENRQISANQHQQYRAMLKTMLNNVLHADLLPEHGGMRLKDIRYVLPEASFQLPAILSIHQLNAWFEAHHAHYPLATLPEHGQPQIPNWLKGFIDLLYEYQGRYYLLDWKSNYLGAASSDYSVPAMANTMATHGYHLQHLLYSMALQRHLRALLPDYDFDRHFGGVLYLFVRAVRNENKTNGVWFHRPDASTLTSFDQLFSPAK